MQIDKSMIIDFLKQHGQHDQAEQASQDLPDRVDTNEHHGLLQKFGVDVSGLIAHATKGDLGPKIGGLLRKD
jgi:hypothetical protein